MLLPVDRPEHRLAQTALAHRLGARGQLEEEDLLLHLGREEEQVHELGDAGAREEAELPSHVGEVGELPALEATAQGVREGKLASDACGVAARRGLLRGLLMPAPGAAALEAMTTSVTALPLSSAARSAAARAREP